MTATRPLVLITGIAQGLGASMAQVFAAAGHDVLGLSRSAAATQQIGRLVGRSPILLSYRSYS
jgi:NAD(P)-dependent dehydrogenase (short-subunit alcohol dehydrogenase family)